MATNGSQAVFMKFSTQNLLARNLLQRIKHYTHPEQSLAAHACSTYRRNPVCWCCCCCWAGWRCWWGRRPLPPRGPGPPGPAPYQPGSGPHLRVMILFFMQLLEITIVLVDRDYLIIRKWRLLLFGDFHSVRWWRLTLCWKVEITM